MHITQSPDGRENFVIHQIHPHSKIGLHSVYPLKLLFTMEEEEEGGSPIDSLLTVALQKIQSY